jgi:16S rRNA (guanine966-N2)-methyltransferase
LFSTLESMQGALAGRAMLDLYAGSGAVGLEAASRGADPVVLVESSPAALTALRANVEALAIPGVVVRAERVERVLAEPASYAFDVVFLDPPYADPVDPTLDLLFANGWLNTGATVVVERATRAPAPQWPAGLASDRSRRYGESTLWYGRRS